MRRWAWLPLVLVACWSTQTVPEAPSASSVERVPVQARPSQSALTYEERWIGGAVPGADVPVVIAVHGMGATPENFAGVMDGWPSPARLILPRAPTPYGDGFAWMTVRSAGGDPDLFARQLDEAAARVATLCVEMTREGRKPVVIGFSQGGMIAWTVATRHPDTLSGAIPMAGFLPPSLLPAAVEGAPPVRALHGMDDRVVPFDRDLDTVTAAQQAGVDATIEAFPATGHAVPRAMRDALIRELTALQAP